MSQAIPSPVDCCTPCPDDITTQLPGPQGAAGAAGTNGTNGVNPFTTLSSGFTVPAELATVQITVATTSWMVQAQGAVEGQILYIQFAGHYEVVTVDSAVLVTVRNLEDAANSLYTDNAPPATAIPTAGRVSPAGLQGPAGTSAGASFLIANNLSEGVAATMRGNLGLGTAALGTTGVADTNVPVINDAAGLTAGEAVFATATGVESLAAGPAQTALGLGTMALQSAAAVAITGGALNGTLGLTTPAAAVVTTLAVGTASLVIGTNTIAATNFWPASAIQSLLAATTVLPNAAKIKVVGNGGAVALVATPTITSPASDGQLLIIQGTSDVNTVTFQDESALAGSMLELGAASRLLGLGDILVLTWDSTDSKWYEVSFSNN